MAANYSSLLHHELVDTFPQSARVITKVREAPALLSAQRIASTQSTNIGYTTRKQIMCKSKECGTIVWFNSILPDMSYDLAPTASLG